MRHLKKVDSTPGGVLGTVLPSPLVRIGRRLDLRGGRNHRSPGLELNDIGFSMAGSQVGAAWGSASAQSLGLLLSRRQWNHNTSIWGGDLLGIAGQTGTTKDCKHYLQETLPSSTFSLAVEQQDNEQERCGAGPAFFWHLRPDERKESSVGRHVQAVDLMTEIPRPEPAALKWQALDALGSFDLASTGATVTINLLASRADGRTEYIHGGLRTDMAVTLRAVV
jgi:hypothetical protein